MNSRDRVFDTLGHKEADRIPIDYWAAAEVSEMLRRKYGFTCQEELLEYFDVDFRYIQGPEYIGPKFIEHPDGSLEDHFGVPRKTVYVNGNEAAASYKEVVKYPLEHAMSVDEVESYTKWPTPEWFDYECVRQQAEQAKDQGKVVVFMGDRLNRCAQLKPAMYIRGVEQILVDILLNPEIARAIFQRIADFYDRYCSLTLEAGGKNIDILFTGDDFGTQKNTFISVESWRDYLKSGFTRFIETGHRYGCKVAHHTCGSIYPLIPEFIECGLDILNPLQPEVDNLNLVKIKQEYGELLSFHGGISIQNTMPNGSKSEIIDEVKSRAEILGPGGGYIFNTAHNFQVDTPLENIATLFHAYKKYGKYS